jgi:hypothetical protein
MPTSNATIVKKNYYFSQINIDSSLSNSKNVKFVFMGQFELLGRVCRWNGIIHGWALTNSVQNFSQFGSLAGRVDGMG